MVLALVVAAGVVCGLIALRWVRRERGRRLIQERTVSAEELHDLLDSGDKPKLFDVRLPLDLLAYSETIPGATRIEPKMVIADPSLIPRDEDTVIYCTCLGDTTSLEILHKAAELDYKQMRILRGGLEGWKAMGYPVERYEEAFHLDTPV